MHALADSGQVEQRRHGASQRRTTRRIKGGARMIPIRSNPITRSPANRDYIWLIMLSPNSEHLICVAPSIWRAKS